MTRKTKGALLGSAAVLAGLGIVALALASFSGAESPKHAAPKSTFSLEQARGFSHHELYFAGTTVDGLPLVAVLRDRAIVPGKDSTGDVVSFIYGDCVPETDTGCAPLAEVQIWPACVRSLALYDASVPGAPVPERTTVRGARAALFDGGLRLEIYSGRSTIVVFADSPQRVRQIAGALRGVNVSVAAEARLPAPAPGALEGTLRC